ncbi:hypothetical protein HanIR_Chr06g0261541 [Helianthus annuus]|nr:hypothetical protein HanIR_Chr06g0261541 [Helianthus annuus]
MISPKKKANVKEMELDAVNCWNREGTVKKKLNKLLAAANWRREQKKQKRRKPRCGRAAGDENETRLGRSNRLIDFNSSRLRYGEE